MTDTINEYIGKGSVGDDIGHVFWQVSDMPVPVTLCEQIPPEWALELLRKHLGNQNPPSNACVVCKELLHPELSA